MIKYEIGQEVWWATFEDRVPHQIECPDCGGTGRIRVIFHDDKEVSIPCGNCGRGYDPPTGFVNAYQPKAEAQKTKVIGMEIEADGRVRYRIPESYIVEEGRLFETKEEAQQCAERLAEEFFEKEKKRVSEKHNNDRTWAWNASYHRTCLKRAKKDIEYHTEKLNAANLKLRKKRGTETEVPQD